MIFAIIRLVIKKQNGFTVIEIVVVILILLAAAAIFFIQKNEVSAAARDQQRKTAINSMYLALEKVYYPGNKNYPRVLDETTLTTIDTEAFVDPNGFKIGDSSSDYKYEGYNCNGNACQSYSLRTTLENESDYVKSNS